MLKLAAGFAAMCLISNICLADEGKAQAHSFANIYATLCMRHLNNLDHLLGRLESVPKLPSEKAAHFLGDQPGDAWPVPDKHGLFVLAIPAGKTSCAVYARRADTEIARELFDKLAASAPPPFVARIVADDFEETTANGRVRTVSYTWSLPNVAPRVLFTLSAAPLDSAEIQVLGSVAIIR